MVSQTTLFKHQTISLDGVIDGAFITRNVYQVSVDEDGVAFGTISYRAPRPLCSSTNCWTVRKHFDSQAAADEQDVEAWALESERLASPHKFIWRDGDISVPRPRPAGVRCSPAILDIRRHPSQWKVNRCASRSMQESPPKNSS